MKISLVTLVTLMPRVAASAVRWYSGTCGFVPVPSSAKVDQPSYGCIDMPFAREMGCWSEQFPVAACQSSWYPGAGQRLRSRLGKVDMRLLALPMVLPEAVESEHPPAELHSCWVCSELRGDTPCRSCTTCCSTTAPHALSIQLLLITYLVGYRRSRSKEKTIEPPHWRLFRSRQ